MSSKDEKLKLSDLTPERLMVNTSIGELYVRPLLGIDLRKLAGIEKEQDLKITGNKTLQLLVSRDSDKSTRDGLSNEDYFALTETDRNLLISAAYKQCNFSTPVTQICISDFGAAVRAVFQKSAESSRKISESFASVLNPNTLLQYRESLEGITNVTEKIRQSIASSRTDDNFRNSEPIVVEVNSPNRFDFSNIPENKATKATVKSAETLEKMSVLLLEMADSVGTSTRHFNETVVPEFLTNLKHSQKSSTRTLNITVGGLVFSAVVSIALTFWQVQLSKESGEDSGNQAKEALATLQHQLEETKSAQDRLSLEFATQRQQNAELNARLIAALKTMPAPIVKIIQPPSPTIPKTNAKDGRTK
jgi:hypothetical protein